MTVGCDGACVPDRSPVKVPLGERVFGDVDPFAAEGCAYVTHKRDRVGWESSSDIEIVE